MGQLLTFGEPEHVARRRGDRAPEIEPDDRPQLPSAPSPNAGKALVKLIRDMLDRSPSTSAIKLTAKNVMTVFRMHGLRFGRIDFTGRLMVLQSAPGWPMPPTHEIDDDFVHMARKRIIENYFEPAVERVLEAAKMLALENHFHPVREYLDSLVWDGTARIETWMHTRFGAADSEYTREVGKLALVAAVRRIRQPGCKFDMMPVLEGPQGSGKSTAVRVLAREAEWFSDAPLLNVDGKDSVLKMQGKWLYEVAELTSVRRAEVESLKAFLSRAYDDERVPYGKLTQRFPRQMIFIGTTNDTTYLADQTGNRRFLPVRTGVIDLDGLRRDLDQLWAEAAELEKTHGDLVLPPHLWAEAERQAEERLIADPWTDFLQEHLKSGEPKRAGKVHTVDLLTIAIGIKPERQTSGDTKRLAPIMNKMGWEHRKSVRIGKDVRAGYVRVVDVVGAGG